MKANELRIGNFVIAPTGEKIHKVIGLTKNHARIITQGLNKPIPYDFLHPIEITEKILLKLNFYDRENISDISKEFAKIIETDVIYKVEIHYQLETEDMPQSIGIFAENGSECPSWIQLKNKIKYLHELQNFWNSFTGTDLECEGFLTFLHKC